MSVTRKALAVAVMAAALVAGAGGIAWAINPDFLTVTVTVSVNLSVDISPNAYDFGTIGANTTTVSTSVVTVTNDSSGLTEDYSINASTALTTGGANWNTSGTLGSGADVYSLCAAFKDAGAAGDADFGNEDCLDGNTLTNQNMSGNSFRAAGSTNDGNNVLSGAARNLWLRFRSPTNITGGNNVQQTATITITAGEASTF